MDLKSREKWVEYSRAKDEMFAHTDIKQAPWYVVDGGRQAPRAAELHLAPAVADPLRGRHPAAARAAPAPADEHYVRPPMADQTFVPEIY